MRPAQEGVAKSRRPREGSPLHWPHHARERSRRLARANLLGTLRAFTEVRRDAPVTQEFRNGAAGRLKGNGNPEQAPERTARAVTLLQEALALLSLEDAVLARKEVAHQADRLIRLPEVLQRTGLRRSAVYEQMQKGTFPRSVKIGPRAATWSEAAVQAWIAKCLDG